MLQLGLGKSFSVLLLVGFLRSLLLRFMGRFCTSVDRRNGSCRGGSDIRHDGGEMQSGGKAGTKTGILLSHADECVAIERNKIRRSDIFDCEEARYCRIKLVLYVSKTFQAWNPKIIEFPKVNYFR